MAPVFVGLTVILSSLLAYISWGLAKLANKRLNEIVSDHYLQQNGEQKIIDACAYLTPSNEVIEEKPFYDECARIYKEIMKDSPISPFNPKNVIVPHIIDEKLVFNKLSFKTQLWQDASEAPANGRLAPDLETIKNGVVPRKFEVSKN